MEYRVFPATGDRLSVLGFGAMGFAGWFGPVDDHEAIRALHTALDLGVNVIDTARAYGRSEQVVGAALRSPTWGHDGYWMDELAELKRSGKARSVGISIPDHRHDTAISLVRSGLIDSVQVILNIFASEPLDALIPICRENNVAVIARCILDEGGLTGSLTPDAEFGPGDFRHGYFDWTVPRKSYLVKVDALRPYVPEHASSLAALAVKFAIHDPGVTTAITSMHVEEYARMNIAAVDEDRLDDDLVWKLRTAHRFEINLSNRDAWPLAARDEVARIGREDSR